MSTFIILSSASILLLLLLSTLSPHCLPASSLSSEMLLLPCLFFLVCAFCLWEWVGSVPVERDLSITTLNQLGSLLVPSVCDGHEWAVWSVKLLSFGWMPIPLTWMHFYIAYIVISSSRLVRSCVSGVLCWTGRLFFHHDTRRDSAGAPVNRAIVWGGQERIGCMN